MISPFNNKANINFRLPNNLKPTFYDLQIKTYIGRNPSWPAEKDFTFEGIIDMTFTCMKPTNEIVFHAINLTMDPNSLKIRTNNVSNLTQQLDLATKSFEYDSVRQFATVRMSRSCFPFENFTLTINYTGLIFEQTMGFYRSIYFDDNGNQT